MEGDPTVKRNFYAALLLVVVSCIVAGSGWYVSRCAKQTRTRVQTAYQAALDGEYSRAKQDFLDISETSQRQSRLLFLLVRRSILDEINESLSLLERYSTQDNLADLGAETARVTSQLDQLEDSFWAVF